ncbi:MAG: YraN family protein, partial [Verrucomicrobiota bacterium]|nr:YraN family protein [Verrucomicrobiota bacterium]
MNEPAGSRNATGLWGERQAERALRGRGYGILSRRVRVGDWDEIDLVARDGEALVFVEVKTRESEEFGRPFSAVDRRKRRALSRAAARYLQQLKKPPRYFRFDVVEVVGGPGDRRPAIRHIENAFQLDRRYRLPYGGLTARWETKGAGIMAKAMGKTTLVVLGFVAAGVAGLVWVGRGADDGSDVIILAPAKPAPPARSLRRAA